MAKDKALTGAAGEYYVAFRLTAEGYAVGLTPRRTASIDLIVNNPTTNKSITIQTKTMGIAFGRSREGEPYWKWRVGKPREPHETFFYALVDLKNDPSQTPDVFIVPSDKLLELLSKWETKGGAEWNWCCIGVEDEPNYRNKWKVIEDELKQSS